MLGTTIRTITVGIGDPHPLDAGTIAQAAAFLRQAQTVAEAAGYTVQTIRIATRPLLADLATWGDAEIVTYADTLQGWLDAEGITFCSLGPAPATDPAFRVERIALLPQIIGSRASLNATVQLATLAQGIRYDAALPTAQAMATLAEMSGGEANFRFGALACCEPGGPFFPQAFAAGPEWRVAVGLQSAGIVREAIAELAARVDAHAAALEGLHPVVSAALADAAGPVVDLVRGIANNAGFRFSGVDLSPAPMGAESIADAFEAVGLGKFGGPGTLAVAAALTSAIKSVALPQCGYCGLMLPPLEDRTIGERGAEGLLTVASLLSYSAVCGTGLDTVPLAGSETPERIAALLLDVATLAYRLRKPLSARLFLVPGGRAGEMTRFTSPYLTNTRILPL